MPTTPNATAAITDLSREDLVALLRSTQHELSERQAELIAAKEYADSLATQLATAQQLLEAAEQERAVILAELDSVSA